MPLLILIILISIVLRFYGLNSVSFWSDELATIEFSSHSSIKELIDHLQETQEPHPPGYYLLIGAIQWFFETNEWNLRLPSAIAGVLCVPMAYLVSRIYIGKLLSLVSCFIIALSPTLIFYSQEARPYSLMVFLSLFVTWIYFKFVNSQKILFALGLLTSAIALIYLHYMGTFFILCLTGFHLCRARIVREPIITGVLFLSLASFLPWLYRSLEQFTYNERLTWIQHENLWDMIQYYICFSLVTPLQQTITPFILIFVTALFFTIFVFALSKKQYRTDLKKFSFPILTILAPLTFIYFRQSLLQPSFSNRYTLTSLPFLMLLTLYTLAVLFEGKIKRKNFAGMISILAILNCGFYFSKKDEFKKADLHNAFSRLNNEVQDLPPETKYALIFCAHQHRELSYFLKSHQELQKSMSTFQTQGEKVCDKENFQKLTKLGSANILILFRYLQPMDPQLSIHLSVHYNIIKTYNFIDGEYTLYELSKTTDSSMKILPE